MTFARLMMALLLMSLTSACLGGATAPADALFKDVSKRPPDARPETITALAKDRPFAQWVIYQDRQCDAHGCIQ